MWAVHMSTTRTIAIGIVSLGMTLCLAAGAGSAQPRPGGGGHPGGAPHIGGGAPRMGGGAPHMGGGVPHMGGGVPHIGGGAPRMGGGAPHFAARPGGGGPHFAPHIGGAPHFAHRGAGGPRFAPHIGGRSVPHFASHAGVGRARGAAHGPHARFSGAGPRFHVAHGGTMPSARGPRGALAAHRVFPHAPHTAIASPQGAFARGHIGHLAGQPGPARFAHLRSFHGSPAFRPFLAARWHSHHHLGWIGPLFWPYAYGAVFYEGLWPYAYASYDPFWYYGYDDIYEGIFSPYDYGEYVQGRRAPARMNALTQSATESCDNEAAEVTGWPIDQIQAALSPNPQQITLLDDLGNAIVKASDVIRSHCPTTLGFTPVDRLAKMQTRLEGLVAAIGIVQPPLAKFYDSLTDEQKARFNAIGNANAKPPKQGQGPTQTPQAACAESVMAFPTDRIDHIVQPDAGQRTKLDALATATAKGADLIKASCPSELPATPPARLAAEGRHLQAMLAAVQAIRAPLADFYNALSDERKARFNTAGRELFAEK